MRSALFLLALLAAQDSKSSSLQLEMTRVYSGENATATAIWCPAEFFRVSFQEKKKFADDDLEKVLDSFRAVNLFAVVAGEAGKEGVRYDPASGLPGRLVLILGEGKEIAPLPDESVSPELRAFAAAMKPAIAASLGPAGKNMAFVFFPGRGSDGRRLADPLAKGALTLRLKNSPRENGAAEFRWKLPLPSLLPEKACSKCAETCRGDWNFCPWDGSKL